MKTNPPSSVARLALIFLAAATAALAAAPPVDLPGWAAGLIAAAAAGFAGLGLIPPSWQVNADRDRAFKKGTRMRQGDHKPSSPPPPPRKRGGSGPRIAMIAALMLTAWAFTAAPALADCCPAGAMPYPNGHAFYGSSTFLHQGNAERFLMQDFPYQSWTFDDAKAQLGEVTYGSDTSYTSSVNNNMVDAVIYQIAYSTRRFCRYHLRVQGVDTAPWATGPAYRDGCWWY